jgi:hypothetical protein
LEGDFLGRKTPHSEAFFKSVIQVISGRRYRDASFFLGPEFDFFMIFLRKLFIDPFLPGSPNFLSTDRGGALK